MKHPLTHPAHALAELPTDTLRRAAVALDCMADETLLTLLDCHI